jgi:hypothetical protein
VNGNGNVVCHCLHAWAEKVAVQAENGHACGTFLYHDVETETGKGNSIDVVHAWDLHSGQTANDGEAFRHGSSESKDPGCRTSEKQITQSGVFREP